MSTINNSKTLYKILDEQRSAGIWKAEESSNEVDYMVMAEDSQMPLIISLEEGTAPQYQNKERAKANIEYAVLASNNLTSIANVLENILPIMESYIKIEADGLGTTFEDLLHTKGCILTYKAAKEALLKIS